MSFQNWLIWGGMNHGKSTVRRPQFNFSIRGGFTPSESRYSTLLPQGTFLPQCSRLLVEVIPSKFYRFDRIFWSRNEVIISENPYHLLSLGEGLPPPVWYHGQSNHTISHLRTDAPSRVFIAKKVFWCLHKARRPLPSYRQPTISVT